MVLSGAAVLVPLGAILIMTLKERAAAIFKNASMAVELVLPGAGASLLALSARSQRGEARRAR